MSGRKTLAILLLGLAALGGVATEAAPQGVVPLAAPSTGTPAAPAAPAPPTDPLERETPRGTILGFLRVAELGRWGEAAEFLELSVARRRANGEELAQKLAYLMDQHFTGDLKRLSDRREGTPQPGIRPDQERIGTIAVGEEELDVLLSHVRDPVYGEIWLIAADTLAKVSVLHDLARVKQVERHLPGRLVHVTPLGMPLWQWLVALLSIPVAAAVSWGLLHLLAWLHRWQLRIRNRPPVPPNAAVIWGPMWLLLGLLLHRLAILYLGIPLLRRHYYLNLSSALLVAGGIWLALRVLQRILDRLRRRASLRGEVGASSLLLLAQRIANVAFFLFAVLVILKDLGFDMTTALAGVGLGGIAIALGAQKTLENLFGGISILSDESLRVGDTCVIGTRVGTVEDISLRSVRVRTIERTELSIPSGTLATMSIENLSRRDKTLFNTSFGLRYETSADQLRYVLAEVRRMLYEHPQVETVSARIRFAGFGVSSLDAEIFCYVLTPDVAEFLAIREDLLLRIMDIVVAAGTAFAVPARMVYQTNDLGLDKGRAEAAAGEVEKWRQRSDLPFPDFKPADISAFRGSIPYPRPDSSLRAQDGGPAGGKPAG